MLDKKINSIGIVKVKILLVKRFKGEKSKLKIRYKGAKLPIIAD